MKSRFLLCLVLLFSFIFKGGAQPGAWYTESLEATVVKTPLIVRGYISESGRTVVNSEAGHFKYALDVHVDEVLKGQPPKPMELTIDVYGRQTNDVEAWIARHTPFLYFINTNNWTPWRAICLDTSRADLNGLIIQPPVTLMDSSTLTNPADILARTRKIPKELGHSTNTFNLGSGWYYLVVPVTPALESRAKQLIRSNDWTSRAEGIKALGYFKSAGNIRLLKPLLTDSNYGEFSYVYQPWNSRRIYYPRKAAYDVLTNWGVQVPEPVWEQGLPWHYDPSVHQELKMPIPSSLSVGRLGPAGDNIAISSGSGDWTNILTGSNLITGVRFEWFVYPAGQPRPAQPTHFEQDYTPRGPLDYFNKARGDNIPEPGQAYDVELDYTLFETDNPPVRLKGQNEFDLVAWRPQDGKNYRVFVVKTLRTTFGP